MSLEKESSKIEEIKKSLYSRNAPDIRMKRRLHFKEKLFDVKPNWAGSDLEKLESATDDESLRLNDHYENNTMSFFKKFLIGSFVFFLAAAGIGAYIVLNGENIISANNVDISISGPITISGGEVLPLDIQVVNKNNIKLEVVDLSIDFPEGTTDPEDTTKELKTFRQTINDIEPGGFDQKTVSAILFGEENTKKEIIVRVEYRVAGSSAIFTKEKPYEILITSSPVSLTVSSFTEVNSKQEFDMTVTVTSNSQEVLKSILLKGVYPFGYTFISSDMKPVGDNSTWRIGDIPPKGKKTITFKGRLDGQDDEDRVFRFTAGAQSVKNDRLIGTQYIASVQTITIKKPFISVKVALDGNDENREYISQFNEQIPVEISWFNNLQVPVIDAEIRVKLSGSAFDKLSVSPDEGFYRSATNEIVWNGVTTNGLSSIGAGESGSVSFSITPRDLGTTGRPIQNPDLSMAVSVSGKRNSEVNVPESVTSSASRHVKVASDVAISGQVLRTVGPISNIGPIPPQAEKLTTYTIAWTIYNSSSNVSNAKVTANLPPYVKWVDVFNPNTEDIKYNSVNGQITWNIGTVGAYTGSGSKKKEIFFQVGMTPSVAQVGQSLNLISDSILTAYDDFTGVSLQSKQSEMDTGFSNDPAYKGGDEKVVN